MLAKLPKPALLKSLNKETVRRKESGKVTKPTREEKREQNDKENEATHDQVLEGVGESLVRTCTV